MEQRTICSTCGNSAKYKCNGCEGAHYCSKQHQKRDWKRHAEICKAFKFADNSTLGRHYIAARNIKAGEIILKDNQPMIAGPMPICVPVCLKCYTILNKEIAIPCKKCGWPLCKHCEAHGLECNFTSSRRSSKVSITEYGYPHPSYQCITVIRALSLKDVDPESYAKLLSLENHCNRIKDNKNSMFGEPLSIAKFIKRFFKAEDISNEEIIKVIGAIQVNGHEVPLTEPPYVAIFERASIVEHNCRANCSKTFTDKGGLIIYAATSIAKGEHISICYTDPLWGTSNRRLHLSETKFFYCACNRCRDPTEFGTMFSAIKCIQMGCSGYMLPKSFSDEEQLCFVCKTCRSSAAPDIIDKILEEIGIYLSNMKKNDVTECKKFLHRYKSVLHPNHFYNIDVTIALSQLIGQESGGIAMTEESLLVEKIELCRKLDNLLKFLVPAENRVRGLILFELHAALAEFSRRHVEENAHFLLSESKRCLSDAYQLLKYEPKVLPEGKVCNHAEKNLQNMNQLLKGFCIT